ncbi:glycosyl hydrolase family 65 protein [Romboutsia lituseburensis]|nr:glycosyl hydrolase family 65 protein [Romboutsia lituseburensis]
MQTFEQSLKFAPKLPQNWDGYSFNINYRDNLLKVEVNKEDVKISNMSNKSINVSIYGEEYKLEDKIVIPIEVNKNLCNA